MNPVPSPYNACTGGTNAHRQQAPAIPRPPLLPLWQVTYTHASGESALWLRAASVIDAIAETRRLHPEMCTATVLPWLDPAAEEASDALCHGHPGAPHPPA